MTAAAKREGHKVVKMVRKPLALALVTIMLIGIIRVVTGCKNEPENRHTNEQMPQGGLAEAEKAKRQENGAENKQEENTRALEEIERAMEVMGEVEYLSSWYDFSFGGFDALWNEANEHLTKARNAYEEENYGAAFGLANSAEMLARNILRQMQERIENSKLVKLDNSVFLSDNENFATPAVPAVPAQPAQPPTTLPATPATPAAPAVPAQQDSLCTSPNPFMNMWYLLGTVPGTCFDPWVHAYAMNTSDEVFYNVRFKQIIPPELRVVKDGWPDGRAWVLRYNERTVKTVNYTYGGYSYSYTQTYCPREIIAEGPVTEFTISSLKPSDMIYNAIQVVPVGEIDPSKDYSIITQLSFTLENGDRYILTSKVSWREPFNTYMAIGAPGVGTVELGQYTYVNLISKYRWYGYDCYDAPQLTDILITRLGSLPKPTLSLPVSDGFVSENKPLFSWGAVSDLLGIKYKLQIANNQSFSSPIISADNLADNQYRTTIRLADGTYYWRVRAVDNINNRGPWSDNFKLVIDTASPGRPTLCKPENGAKLDENKPSFEWTCVNDNSGVAYTLVIDDNLDFPSPTYHKVSILDNQHVIENELPDGTYYWRVRSVDNAGNVGNWSNYRLFTIDITSPAVPLLVSPAAGENLNNNTSTFDWSEVADAAYYQLQVDNDPDFASSNVDVTVIATTYTSATVLVSKTYYWHVRAADQIGNVSVWSASRSFNIVAKPMVQENIATNVLVTENVVVENDATAENSATVDNAPIQETITADNSTIDNTASQTNITNGSSTTDTTSVQDNTTTTNDTVSDTSSSDTTQVTAETSTTDATTTQDSTGSDSTTDTFGTSGTADAAGPGNSDFGHSQGGGEGRWE
jgi:hypothetical protein